MISTEQFSRVLVEIADTLVDDFDLIDFLHRLTDHAAQISGASAVGLLLSDQQDRLQYMAASNESGRFLELLQLQNSEGPCLDCYSQRTPVINADLATADHRWPTFAPAALSAGFRSVHAFPMRWHDGVIGALGLFGREATPVADDEAKMVQALADIATIALLQERTIARSHQLTEQLQGALTSRVVIEQAKGALAQQQNTTPAEAFTLLRSRARGSGQRLVDVANELLHQVDTRRYR